MLPASTSQTCMADADAAALIQGVRDLVSGHYADFAALALWSYDTREH